VAKSKRTGRIPKLTPEVQTAIVRDIAAGVPREHAAERASIHRATLFRWLARGRKDRTGPYRDLCDAVKKAEADALAASVARIRRAAQGGQVIERTTITTTKPDGTVVTKSVEKVTRGEWTADAWWLERRHPDEFAGNRHEAKELREQLQAVLKLVSDGKLGATPPAGPTADALGGEAAPESV
jgi:hypothetical protein